jgi:hypothetical protein
MTSSAPTEKFSRKIQSIYNGKCDAIAMQVFAQAWEKPATQEQWETMQRTMKNNALSNRTWSRVVHGATRENARR